MQFSGLKLHVRTIISGHFGVNVNRLIRTDYGPYRLKGLKRGDAREVPSRSEIKSLLLK